MKSTRYSSFMFDFSAPVESYMRQTQESLFVGPGAVRCSFFFGTVSRLIISTFPPLQTQIASLAPMPLEVQIAVTPAIIQTSRPIPKSPTLPSKELNIMGDLVSPSTTRPVELNQESDEKGESIADESFPSIDISPIKHGESSVEQETSPQAAQTPLEKFVEFRDALSSSLDDSQNASFGSTASRKELTKMPCVACGGTKTSIRCTACNTCWHLNCSNLIREDFLSTLSRATYLCPTCQARNCVPAATRAVIGVDQKCGTEKSEWTQEEVLLSPWSLYPF